MTAAQEQRFTQAFKDFPRLTDKHKQLVLGAALRLAEVQGRAASPQGLKGLGRRPHRRIAVGHCENNASFK
jgi:hypothetical protein